MKPIYYPNLTGLRAIAASLVFVHHFDQISILLGLGSFHYSFIIKSGQLGVLLFFVLSGFLITNLILNEQNRTGKINVKKFYFRRLLRIWPVYFLMVGLGFFVFPKLEIPVFSDYDFAQSDFFLFVFMSAQVVLINGTVIPGIAPLWSVAVEEYYYLVWPWLMKMKSFLIPVSSFFAFMTVYPIILNPLGYDIHTILPFIKYIPFDGLAIGSLSAYLIHLKPKVLDSVLFNKKIQITTLLVLILIFFCIDKIPYLDRFSYSILFAYIIVNLARNDRCIFNLEKRYLIFLGEISYGIYMYHSSVIFILFYILKNNQWAFNLYPVRLLLLCILFYLLTVFLSYISFRYYENVFLRIKRRYI